MENLPNYLTTAAGSTGVNISANFPIPRDEALLEKLIIRVNNDMGRQIVLLVSVESEEESKWHEAEYQISQAKLGLLQTALNHIRGLGNRSSTVLLPLK
jgi:hypothetical protein